MELDYYGHCDGCHRATKLMPFRLAGVDYRVCQSCYHDIQKEEQERNQRWADINKAAQGWINNPVEYGEYVGDTPLRQPGDATVEALEALWLVTCDSVLDAKLGPLDPGENDKLDPMEKWNALRSVPSGG